MPLVSVFNIVGKWLDMVVFLLSIVLPLHNRNSLFHKCHWHCHISLQWGILPRGHWWTFYPGTRSWSQISSSQDLAFVDEIYLYMTLKLVALTWLIVEVRYRSSIPSNDHHDGVSYSVNNSGNELMTMINHMKILTGYCKPSPYFRYKPFCGT